MTGDALIPPSPKDDPDGPPPDDAALFAENEPFALFERWFTEARAKEPNDPNAMALATVDASGLPDVRMVLMKGFEQGAFVFYTNAESAKQMPGDTPAAEHVSHITLRLEQRSHASEDRPCAARQHHDTVTWHDTGGLSRGE